MAAKKKTIRKIPAKKTAKKPKKYKETRKRVNRRKKKAFDVKTDNPLHVYSTLVRRYLTRGQPCAYLPGELLEKFAEYVSYVEENPLLEYKAFSNGYTTRLPHIRAMSLHAFCTFACMHRDTFNTYEKDPNYSDITKFIRDSIYMQKFEGAAANLLNANIIARDLGLIDKTSMVDDDGNALLGWNYITPPKPTNEL
jgi:hypothetical protein